VRHPSFRDHRAVELPLDRNARIMASGQTGEVNETALAHGGFHSFSREIYRSRNKTWGAVLLLVRLIEAEAVGQNGGNEMTHARLRLFQNSTAVLQKRNASQAESIRIAYRL
jgi:hypothetical protein